MGVNVKIIRIDKGLPMPKYGRPGDAGFDLYSTKEFILKPGERAIIGSGVKIEVPKGYVGLLWDRSGLGVKNVLKTLGGVLDSTYRGEIIIGIVNLSGQVYHINRGDKIVQMLIQPVEEAELEEAEELTETIRGEQGLGSSGR